MNFRSPPAGPAGQRNLLLRADRVPGSAVVAVYGLVMTIIGGIQANDGVKYRYPLTLRPDQLTAHAPPRAIHQTPRFAEGLLSVVPVPRQNAQAQRGRRRGASRANAAVASAVSSSAAGARPPCRDGGIGGLGVRGVLPAVFADGGAVAFHIEDVVARIWKARPRRQP